MLNLTKEQWQDLASILLPAQECSERAKIHASVDSIDDAENDLLIIRDTIIRACDQGVDMCIVPVHRLKHPGTAIAVARKRGYFASILNLEQFHDFEILAIHWRCDP